MQTSDQILATLLTRNCPSGEDLWSREFEDEEHKVYLRR